MILEGFRKATPLQKSLAPVHGLDSFIGARFLWVAELNRGEGTKSRDTWLFLGLVGLPSFPPDSSGLVPGCVAALGSALPRPKCSGRTVFGSSGTGAQGTQGPSPGSWFTVLSVITNHVLTLPFTLRRCMYWSQALRKNSFSKARKIVLAFPDKDNVSMSNLTRFTEFRNTKRSLKVC